MAVISRAAPPERPRASPVAALAGPAPRLGVRPARGVRADHLPDRMAAQLGRDVKGKHAWSLGGHLIGLSDDGELRVLDGDVLRQVGLPGVIRAPSDVALHPSGARALVKVEGREVLFSVDLPSARVRGALELDEAADAVCFVAGDRLVVAGDARVRLTSADGRLELASLRVGGRVSGLFACLGGRVVLVGLPTSVAAVGLARDRLVELGRTARARFAAPFEREGRVYVGGYELEGLAARAREAGALDP